MTSEWHPSGGVLTTAEVRRALASRPCRRREGDGLARELRCRDFASARGLGDRLADEVTYFGRHADIAIHDDGRLVVSLAGPNRGGVTVAELALADEVDGVIERTGGAALPRII